MNNLINTNLCFMVDSYKVTHWKQFPKGMTHSFYYVESRGGKYDRVMQAGVHYLTAILEKGVSVEDVEEAKELFDKHFQKEVFNYDGWMRIAKEFGGKLPIRIRAVQEGTVVPVKNVILTVENTCPDQVDGEFFGWLCGYLETLIMRAVWYPSTVATISYESVRSIKHYMDITSDLTMADYDMIFKSRMHDFGARGVSSGESAGIGGLAHLYNSLGTDTVESLQLARKLFKEDMAGFSIPAREHSTTTCYTSEDNAFQNSVDNYGGGVFAMVMDSYDYEDALKRVTDKNSKFFKKLTESGGICVLRPDSGNPVDVVMTALQVVARNVGYTLNSKGYKVLDPRFRVIQGDGVDGDEIWRILTWMEGKKFAAENVAFGMGGGLLQRLDRDTQRYAMKCSAMKVDGEWREVFKAPKTDMSKASKKGFLDLIKTDDGEFHTFATIDRAEYEESMDIHSEMETVFEDGVRMNTKTLSHIRDVAYSYLPRG